MKPAAKNSGFALLIVLLIIAVLSALVSEFLFSAKINAELLANHRDGTKARYIGRSGVNAFKYLIEAKLLSSAFQPNLLALSSWVGYGGGLTDTESGDLTAVALGYKVDPLAPDPEGPLRGQWYIPLPSDIFALEDGEMFAKLINERGKLNINSLVNVNGNERTEDVKNIKQYNRFVQLFDLLGIESEDALTCIDGMVDWIDGDMSTQPLGAEDDHYRSLEPNRYYPRNNFFKSVDEMRLVNGCTPEVVEKVREFVTVYPRKGIAGFFPDDRVDAAAAPKAVLMAYLMASPEDGGAPLDKVLADQIAEEIYAKAIEKSGITISKTETGIQVASPSLVDGPEVVALIGGRLPWPIEFYGFTVSDPQFYQIKSFGAVNNVRAGVVTVFESYNNIVKIVSWEEQ